RAGTGLSPATRQITQRLVDSLLQRTGQACETQAPTLQLLLVPLVLPAAKGLVLARAVLYERKVIGAQKQMVVVPLGQLLQLNLGTAEQLAAVEQGGQGCSVADQIAPALPGQRLLACDLGAADAQQIVIGEYAALLFPQFA